jgi:hypothetical protein
VFAFGHFGFHGRCWLVGKSVVAFFLCLCWQSNNWPLLSAGE